MTQRAPGSTPAWFVRLGEPLVAIEVSAARDYCSALSYPLDLSVRSVGSWDDAERIIRAKDWDRDWWERESRERQRLTSVVRERLDAAVVMSLLTAASDASDTAIESAIGQALVRAHRGESHDAMMRAAGGAASMALHEFALARLAGCGPEHLFVRKYRLFEMGRWPLGVLHGAFYLF